MVAPPRVFEICSFLVRRRTHPPNFVPEIDFFEPGGGNRGLREKSGSEEEIEPGGGESRHRLWEDLARMGRNSPQTLGGSRHMWQILEIPELPLRILGEGSTIGFHIEREVRIMMRDMV